jgi:hypothetical protein
MSWFYDGVDPTLSDTINGSASGNTWIPLTLHGATFVGASRFFYCANPAVGNEHIFTFARSNIFPSMRAYAWTGNHASPADQENGTYAFAAHTLNTGNASPGEANELVLTGCMFENNSGGAVSVSSPFSTPDVNAYSGGNAEGGATAYSIQTSATTENPAWEITNNASVIVVSIATFKAGAAGNPWYAYAQQRVITEIKELRRTWGRKGFLWTPEYVFS